MNFRQAKKRWESKYNVGVMRTDFQKVKVTFYDNLTINLVFICTGNHWFTEDGDALQSPGWIVREKALEAQEYKKWLTNCTY